MRIFATIAAAFLCIFLVTSAPAFSQDAPPEHPRDENARDKDAKGHDARQDNQNARQDDRRQQDESRPDARQQDNRDRNDTRQPDDRDRTRQQEQARPEDRRNDNASRPEDRREQDQRGQDQGRVQEREHTRVSDQGRAGGERRGMRIPDERFRAGFGREHRFHVERTRIINQSQPEFVYGGYTFELAQPWPAEWAYDDDCYVDYVDDDYYLYDAYHPGMRILLYVIGG